MLVLALASPRRRELLTQAGFSFEFHPTHIPEDPRPSENPTAYVIRLAREKAEAASRELALCQGTTLQTAEKLDIPGEIGGIHPSGSKARADFDGFMRGLKPPPPSGWVFSAACLVVPQRAAK